VELNRQSTLDQYFTCLRAIRSSDFWTLPFSTYRTPSFSATCWNFSKITDNRRYW